MKLTDEQIAHVRSLEKKDGRITPDIVIADAKKKHSPIHSLFDWNQARAALERWRDVAREVIWSVTVLTEHTDTTVKTIGYIRDPDAKGNEQGYRSIESVAHEPVAVRKAALIYALSSAAGNLRRAQQLSVVFGLEYQINKLIEQVMGLQLAISENGPNKPSKKKAPAFKPNGKGMTQQLGL